MTAPVLFLDLDLDGVANDAAYIADALRGHERIVSWSMPLAASTLDPARVARVQRVCDETGAVVVLVSGWRRWAPCHEITEALRSRGLTAPVLGAVDGVKMSGETRASATREWLASRSVQAWCVLDDERRHWTTMRAYERSEVRDGRRVIVCGHEEHTPAWLAGRCVHPVDGITDDDAARCVAILRGDHG